MRGNGRIFARKNTAALWCAYYLRGKEFRESTGHSDPKKAERFLHGRLREVGADQIGARPFVGRAAERIQISCGVTTKACDCLCCALERDFRFRGKASAQNISNLNRVRQDFGGASGAMAIALTGEEVDEYIERRFGTSAGRTAAE